MKVLVTGANGQLGHDIVKRLKTLNYNVYGFDREDFDLTQMHETKRFIRSYNPDVVIHCAAYTAVDRAEDEKEQCYQINVLGTRYIAEVCKEIDAMMVYISTDYVFDGIGDQPFTEEDTPNPINYYGRTKYEGELEVKKLLDKYFIFRISWVFGINGNNFLKTMLRLANERDELSIVVDQIGSPTYTYDLSKLISEVIQTDKYGIYHATNEGFCSWYDFAREIFKLTGVKIKVNPIKTEDFPTAARRPKNSRLSKDKLIQNGFKNLPTYKDALKRYIVELQQMVQVK